MRSSLSCPVTFSGSGWMASVMLETELLRLSFVGVCCGGSPPGDCGRRGESVLLSTWVFCFILSCFNNSLSFSSSFRGLLSWFTNPEVSLTGGLKALLHSVWVFEPLCSWCNVDGEWNVVTLLLVPVAAEDTAVGVILLGVIVFTVGDPMGGNSCELPRSNTGGLSNCFHLCPLGPPLSPWPDGYFPLLPDRRLLDPLCDDELSWAASPMGLFLPLPLGWLSGVTRNWARVMVSSFLDPDPGVFRLDPPLFPPLQEAFLPCLPSPLVLGGVTREGSLSPEGTLETGVKSLSDQPDLDLLSDPNSWVRLTFDPALRWGREGGARFSFCKLLGVLAGDETDDEPRHTKWAVWSRRLLMKYGKNSVCSLVSSRILLHSASCVWKRERDKINWFYFDASQDKE